MKKYAPILFVFASIVMHSCTSSLSFYQLYSVESDLPVQNDDKLMFEDENLRISYDLWSEGGALDFMIYNKSTKNIIINMGESFYILNGISYDYFQNRTFVYNNYSQEESKIITIPPLSGKIISEFNVTYSRLISCDLPRIPSKNTSKSIKFIEEDSPFIFINKINYCIGETAQELILNHKFFVTEISNLHSSSFYTLEHLERCGKLEDRLTAIPIFASPARFYIKYTSAY